MRGPLAAFGGACALSLSLTAPVVGDAPALAPATTSPPTVTINQAAFQADPTTASLIYFTVKFSKPVTGFTAGDVSLAGSTATGDLTAFVSGSGASYSVWVAGMTGPGRVVATIPAGVARDSANNGNLASTSTDNSVTYKRAGPAVTINQRSTQPDPTNVSPILFDVTFSTAVTGFDASDVNFAGSTVGGALVAQVSGSGASYVVSVSGMSGNGTIVASIPAGAARDGANNSSFASSSTDNAVAFDNSPPSVTINQAANQTDPATSAPILFTVTFSEPVTGFAADDISLAGSTAGGSLAATVSGTGPIYTVSVTGMTTSGTVIASIPAGAASDAVGNTNTASTSSDHVVTYSSIVTVSINQAPAQPDPTNASPILFNVLFSAPVTGFDGSDVMFAGSTVGGALVATVTGSGASYSVSVTGMAGTGTVMPTIPAGVALDAVSRPNQASTSTDNIVSFDGTPPTVTINQAAAQSDPTAGAAILFTVSFSEPVTGFTTSDVSFAGSTAGGTLSASVSGSGANYTVSVTGMAAPGTVKASLAAGAAQDAAGNPTQASISTDNVVTFDNSSPTVTINQATTQVDPTRTSPIVFTVTFNEPVTGFTASDVSFAGSTAGGPLTATVSGSGANYSVSVTGMTAPGLVATSIPAGAAQDAANNPSQASTSSDNTVSFDNVAPTVTINQAIGQLDPTATSPIVFTVTFSEPVTGFAADDVTFSGSTVGGALSAGVTGSGATYTVTVTGMSGTGAVVASVTPTAAMDASGNDSAASTSTDNVVTYLPTGPSVTLNQSGLQSDPTSGSPIAFAVVFSAPVTGFDGADISFAGSTAPGPLAAAVTGSGANYTVSVSGMTGPGLVVASIPAGAAVDGANNSSQASTSVDNHVTFDNAAPTVTINQAATQVDPTSGSPIAFTVTFSEPVNGFTASDLSLAGSTVTGTLAASVTGSGATYTVTVTGMSGSGVVVASIGAGAANDAAGNASAASTSSDNVVTFDNSAPTVTINQAPTQTDPATASPLVFTVSFSEPVSGFTGADVSFAGSTVGGTLAAAISGSGPNYTISVTGMNGAGSVVASIPAGAAIDAAGNASTASTSADNVVAFAPVGPTVTINQAPGPIGRSGQPDPTNASPIVFTVVFSAPVTGFDSSDVAFTGSTVGGTLVASVSGSGAAYTVNVSGMTGNGTVVATIPAGAAVDGVGAPSRASTSTDNSVTFDTAAPAVTIDQAVAQADPTNTSPVQFAVTFSEPVVGFTAADVSFAGSTVGGALVASVTGSGASYIVSVTGMIGSGVVVASIPAAAAKDAAGNNSLASTSTDNSVTFTATGPAVTINQAAGQADPTNTSPIAFTVIFSAPVTGFTGSDVSFSGSTVGGPLSANVTGSGTAYAVSVTGMTGSGVVVASIPGAAAVDALGNPSAASSSTDNRVTFDTGAPTVTINQAAGQADPTNTSPVVFSVVFSAPVTGFAGSDVSFAGSTVAGTLVASVTGSGATYTVSVTGMTGTGIVVASIPAGAAVDALGNPTAASTSTDKSVTFDSVAPTVTINQAVGQADPTNTSPVQFTVVFSEPVSGFTSGDVLFAGSTVGGTLAATVSGSGATYNVSVTGMTGSGAVIATIPAAAATDATGNPSVASTSADNTVTFDNVSPTVTVNQAAGQPDPTNAAAIQFTVTFSAPVTGFTSSDVSFTGSTAAGTLAASVTGAGPTYTVSVAGMTSPGTVVVSIPAGAAVSAANNPSQASTSADNVVTFDNVVPTVTINQASTQVDPTNAAPILFSVVFSEPVIGFSGTDVSFAGSTVGGALVANITGSGANYTVSVTGMAGSGTLVASIPAGGITDLATNPNTASTSTDNSVTYNEIAPTVTINQAATQADPTNAGPIVFSVVFSTPVSGFAGNDVSFTGSTAPGTLVAAVTGSGTTYTVSVTGMTGGGTVVASIPAAAAQDAAANPSQASSSTDNIVTFDTTAPTVTINQAAAQADPTNAPAIVFSVVFSEPVNGFASNDLSFSGSTVGGTLAASVSGSGANYSVSVSGMTGTGTVVATIPAGAAADAAGNPSAASTSTDNTVSYNATLPTVTINQAADQADPTNATPIVFTVVFSTPVTGFTTSDVNFAGSTAPGTLVASITGSGSAYTVSVTGMTGSGSVVASIPAGAAQDAAANLNQASTSTDNVVTFDTTAPTVTINQAVAQSDPTNATPIAFTVVFSEPVSGFAANDVSLSGTAGGTLAAIVTGSGANYTVSVSGMTGIGTVVATIPAGVAADAAGNSSAASTSTDNTVTYNATAPSVTINQAAGQADPTSVAPITFSASFSVPVTGFTASDVSLTGTTAPGATASVTGSGSSYTVSVSGMTGSGTVVVTVPSGVAVDDAGNANQASTSTDNSVTYDVTGPRVTSATPSGTGSGPLDRFTLTFNEAIQPSSFTLADIVSLTGPGGTIAPTSVNVLNSQQVEVVFPSQTSGSFTLVVGPDIRDLAGNPMDQNANGLNDEAILDRYTTGFTISGTAALTTITPSSGQQGQNLNVVVTGQFTNFVNGVTTAGFSGTGVVVNSVTVTTPTSATINIDISPIASRDQRSVTLTTNTEVVSSGAAGTFFTVTASAAAISLVNPDHGNQGDSLSVDITGFQTHFANGATSLSFGTGVSVSSLLVTSATSLTATISISPTSAIGGHDVTVTTAGESVTSPGAFTVNPGVPEVTSAAPSSAHQIDTLSVVINARFTHFDASTTADFGSGITVNSVIADSGTSATVNITIAHNATVGARTVVMHTGLESAQKVGVFTVLPGTPRLDSITPVAGVQGTSTTLILNGLFTHFTQGTTSVSLGTGITTGTVTVNGPELASVPITISDGGSVGARSVMVTTGTESVTLVNGFTVVQGQPRVAIIDPNAAQRGTTLNVTLTGQFTNWQNGVTHATYGPGITVNSNIVAGATQLTTNITIDPVAALAPRDVVIITGTEVLTVFGGFTVNDVDVTPPSVLTFSPAYGSTGVPLNVVPTIEWNEPLARATVNTTSIQLFDGFTGQSVPGTVTLDATGRIVSFVPDRLLAVSRSYTLYAGYSTPVRDVAGNAGGTYASFTTGFTTETTGPSLIRSNPADGDAGIAVNTVISLQFNHPINAATRASGLQILRAGVPVDGVFTFADALRQISFAPAVPWSANATYTIALGAGLTDIAGNPLTNPGNRTFTAGATADNAGPQVVSYSPTYGDTGVALRPIIRVAFDERVNPITFDSSIDYLYNNSLGVFVPAALSVANDRLSATLTPTADLNPFTSYYFQFTSFRDIAGNYGGGVGAYFTTGSASDSAGPTVTSIAPASGAVNVPVNAIVRVVMSELMDPTSISNATVLLTPSVAGAVSLQTDQKTIKLTLNGNLAPSTTYAVNVSGARDLSGNVMTPFTASFTTSSSATADTTAPVAISFSPATGSTNVAVTSPISMTLNEPIDPAQVGPNSQRVFANSVQVSGTYAVSNGATVVTFTPSAPYPTGTTIYMYTNYDGTVTDFAGNPLQSTLTYFTTAGSPPDTTAPSVVSITPANGTVGVGPQALITLTFSESMNLSANDSQNFAVFAGGTPVGIGISRSADNRMVLISGTWPLNTVMTVAATAGNTDLSGNHLTPFTSTFTTAAAFDSTRASIVTQLPFGSGASPATPITLYANKPLNAATIAGALYVSQDGILVDGDVAVTGNGTAISFTPAAPFAASAVIQIFLTADAQDSFGNTINPYSGSFTVAADPATTAPTIIRTSPTSASVNNPLNSIVEIEFSEPLDPATVNPTNISLLLFGGGQPIGGTLSLRNGNRTIRFVPGAPLQAAAYYYVQLLGGIHDAQGTPFSGTTYYFYVGQSTDSAAPSIVSVAPANGFTGVGINAAVRVVFSEPIDALSITPGSVTLSTPAGQIPATFVFSNNNTALRIVPENPLPAGTVITLSVDVSDVAGNELPPVQSQFTTGAAADTTAPLIVNTNWSYGQIVPINTVFEVVFNEPVDVATILSQQSTFLADGRFGGYVAGTLVASADARTFTFTPGAPLAVDRPYYVQVNGGIDLAGNVMSGFSSYAITDFRSDVGLPAVTLTNPVAGQTNVPRNAKIRVLFNEPIALDTIDKVRLLRNGSPLQVSANVSTENRLVTLTPAGLLASNAVYTIDVAQVRDTTGNVQAPSFTATFTTSNDVDLVTPSVTGYSPYYGQLVPLNVVLRVAFSEPIDPITVNPANFYLYNAFGQPNVPVAISFAADRRSATLTPTIALLPNSLYYASISGYTDFAGNPGSSASMAFYTTNVHEADGPAVVSVLPANGASAVPVNARIVLTFNESIDVTSLISSAIQLTPAVSGTVTLSSDQTTLVFTPASPLSTSTVYSVQVTGLRNAAGLAMLPFSSTFVTGGSTAPDTTAPVVLSSSPVNGAAGVAVNSSITFTTSEPISRMAIGAAANPVLAFVPNIGSVQVAGTYSVDATNTIVTFTPAAPYPANTTIAWYTNYNGQVTDAAGNLLQSLASQFTTGSTADTTAPTLVSLTPADGATDLGLVLPITLTFSESIAPATSDYNTIALFNGSTRVSVNISRSADNRMLFLSAGLSPDTTYTIVATSGIQDLSGNSFAGATATFTTAPFDNTRPNIVSQRPIGSGVAAGTRITLFTDSALDPSTVPGAVYVIQNGVLIPGNVAVSGSGRTIVFTPDTPFAAGTVVEITVTATATDPGRNPIFPYYGSFTVAGDPATSAPTLVQTNPGQASGNNPLNSRIDLEFSEPLNPTTVTPATFGVYLFGGGTAIPGTLSLTNGNRTIHFVPDGQLQAGAYYYVIVSTGVQDVQGMPFGSTSYYFYVGTEADTTNPAVNAIAPPNGSAGVGINAVGVIRFNEPVNPVTVNSATVSLMSGTAVPFVLSHSTDYRTYYVTPQVPLPSAASVTLSINGVQDTAGNAAPSATATFTTSNAPDTVRPSVVAFSTVYGDTNVPVNTVLQIMFDEPMDPGSVTADANVYLYDNSSGTGYVTGGTVSLSSDGKVLTYLPPANLISGHSYTFTSSTMPLDLAGNQLNATSTYFVASTVSDTTAPTVIVVSPPSLTGVPRNALVEILFDEPVRATALGQVNILAGGNPLPVASRTLSNGNRQLTITLAGIMAANTAHTISIAGVRDIAGNLMPTVTSVFTTGSGSDLLAPSATVTFSPVSDATGVPVTVHPSVTFSEPLDPVRVVGQPPQSSSGVYLYLPATGQYVAATYSMSADYRTVIVTPMLPLQSETQYELIVYFGVVDLAGNAYPTVNYSFFTTQ